MTKIAQVAVGVINLIEDGHVIYSIAANAMDAVEAQSNGLSGADKKAWVMSFVKSVVFNIIENWDRYEVLISNFIDSIKTAYNAVRSLVENDN